MQFGSAVTQQPKSEIVELDSLPTLIFLKMTDSGTLGKGYSMDRTLTQLERNTVF